MLRAVRPWGAVLPGACCEAFWESGGSRGPVLVDAGGRQAPAGSPQLGQRERKERPPIWGEAEF